jgi:hypothetical protein
LKVDPAHFQKKLSAFHRRRPTDIQRPVAMRGKLANLTAIKKYPMLNEHIVHNADIANWLIQSLSNSTFPAQPMIRIVPQSKACARRLRFSMSLPTPTTR